MENEKKLNIGLFVDAFYPMIDGVVTVVDNYAKRMSKIANVTVFAPHGRTEFDDSTLGYKVVRCKRLAFLKNGYDLATPNSDKSFKNALKESNLDIVHIHSPFTIGRAGLKYAKKHNIPCIATMHSQFKQDFMKATKNKLLTKIMLSNIMSVFNKCDQCWAVNKELAKVFKEYGYKREPIVYNNGTDFLPVADLKEACKIVNEKYNIDPSEKVLLFVGRITALKNVFFIAESLKRLSEKGYKYKMLYVGSGPDDEKLREFVKELGIEDDVVFCGRISDRDLISKIYARAHLFLFPSMYDASSLVQIEAASQSTPTVFLQGAVTAGTVTNDVNGFVVENSVDAFADKIMETIDNPDYYERISKGSKEDLYKTWDEIVVQVVNDYKAIIEEKKKN
ncbi:MAG: glycosyltransferase family 4 protein [Clostridiales bacterium]|nr:glycosyltransferase family 4 protein [Clostridiales bacterium]